MSPIVFVPLLAATTVVGAAIFAYAAHCFLTVVEQTAAGNDEVVWPNEPMYDWLWQAVYVLWLTALWLGPVVLALRAVAGAHAGAAAAGQVLVSAGAAVWLGFPITLLSSMSGSSRWILLSPRLLARLFGQRAGPLFLFYLHSGPVLAAAVALTYLTFFVPGGMAFVVGTAAGLAAALLVYARQLGRLAHLVEHTSGRTPATQRVPSRRPRVRSAAAYDPWSEERNRPRQPRDLPPVMSPLEGPITGYDVNYDDRPAPEPPPPPRHRPIDLDDVPYELEGSPNVDPPRGPMPANFHTPSEYEMALARGGTAPPPPAHPWMVGVYNFPFYQESLMPLVKLAGGFLVIGVMAQTLIAVKP